VLVRARELGVKVAIGTDAAHRFFHVPDGVLELEYLQALGYPPLEVIRAATATAAEAIARADQVGTLEPGKLGDVLIVDGDPAGDVRVLRDKRRIVRLLKGGEEQPREPAGAVARPEFDVSEALLAARATPGG
jgi:imidazolonepropionase-like amidohydrolase